MQEKKERQCIGVLMAKPNMNYQASVLRGISRAVFAEDMNIAVFSNVSLDGETELFSVFNPDRLAGIIYVPYSFDRDHADKVIRPRLLKAIRDRDYPVVTIDRKLDEIPCVTSCDDITVSGVIEHFINEHGCKDIAFLTGTKGHDHAESRLEVFRKTMEKYSLPVAEDRVFYGDFWFGSGEPFVEFLLKSERGLPEAIICANENMAYAVYRSLYQRKIFIPENVLLAAYRDNADSFSFLSGAVKDTEDSGYTAGKMIIEKIKGGKIGDETLDCGCQSLYSVSCGCIPLGEYDLSELAGTIIHNRDSYMSDYNQISADLLNRKTFHELFWGIDWYSLFLKNTLGVYFCMCDGWDKPDLGGKAKEWKYPDRMQLYYYRMNFPNGEHKSVFENREFFPTNEMLPRIFSAEGEPTAYIFRSLFSEETLFGYIVIDIGDCSQTYVPEFDYWLKDVTNAMETQRRLLNMKYLYSSDLMTGIYNRNGFNNMMPEMIKYASEHKTRLFIALFDLNGMKFINDTYGHLEGDNSIKTAADIISDCTLASADDERNFRIGGDEFVKAAVGNFTDEEVWDFRKRFERRVKEYNTNSNKAYPIYISLGICLKSPEDEYDLDSVLVEADKEMFMDKARIRKATGFNPKRNT